MISNIIDRDFFSINKKCSILWTPAESTYFADFIREACDPCVLIDFDKTFYALNNIFLVVCNNRLIYLDRCVELAKHFHAPLLIIDHSAKTSMVSSEYKAEIPFSSVYSIALTKEIYLSWGKIHDIVLEYGNDKNIINKWKNIVFQLIKTRFIMKDHQYGKK